MQTDIYVTAVKENDPQQLKQMIDEGHYGIEAEGDIVGTVIKLADIIALIQFLKTERALGNQDATLLKVIRETYDNLGRYLDHLEEIVTDEQAKSVKTEDK